MAGSGDTTPTTLSMRNAGGPPPGPPGQEALKEYGPSIPLQQYNFLSSIYRTIANRLAERYRIRLSDQVSRMYPDGKTLGEGVNFIPADSKRLKTLLTDSGGFHWDDRRIFLYREAASHTIGEGYREYGIPSLHFQLAEGFCNVHLDTFGFVFRMPNGDVFTPDMFQHIVDELWWADLIKRIRKTHPFAAELLQRAHPILPNSTRAYRPAVGAGIELYRRYSSDASGSIFVTVEFVQDVSLTPCNPASCSISDQATFGKWQVELKAGGRF